MEKTTVLAKMRLTLELNEAAKDWLRRSPEAWFAQRDGDAFLAEFGGRWERVFVEVAEHEVQAYFRELSVPLDHLPIVQTGERYTGWWILEAAVVMVGTVGTAYTALKGVSELPAIADGLGKLKDRIAKKVRPNLDSAVHEQLTETAQHSTPKILGLTPLPRTATAIDLVIDARPIRSLTPALMRSHRVHLSVGVSRDSFTLENLDDTPTSDVRLGLFRTATERHQWAYQDAYMGGVPLLSGKQTIAKPLSDFRDSRGNRLDMSDGAAAYVDCWVEDRHGIYLFRFFLDQE